MRKTARRLTPDESLYAFFQEKRHLPLAMRVSTPSDQSIELRHLRSKFVMRRQKWRFVAIRTAMKLGAQGLSAQPLSMASSEQFRSWSRLIRLVSFYFDLSWGAMVDLASPVGWRPQPRQFRFGRFYLGLGAAAEIGARGSREAGAGSSRHHRAPPRFSG